MASWNRPEVEASLRAQAMQRGEEISDLRWNGEDPAFSLASRARTKEETTEAAKALLTAALKPVVTAAVVRSLQAGFNRS